MKKNKLGKLLFAPWAANSPFYSARQFWYNPMKKIFKELIIFDPLENLSLYGKEEMNRKFLGLIKREQPDYIFLWLICSEFYIDTLLKIREISPKSKIINFAGDDDARFYDYSLFNMLLVDYFLVTHKEYVSKYSGRAFLSLAMDTDAFKPMKCSKKYDVTFIGTAKCDRPEFIRYLKDNKINIRVFGAEWEHHPELRSIYGGRVNHEDFAKIIHQTKINLCFTKNHEGKKHLNQHTFEAGASKEFILTENSPEYCKYFTEGKNLVSFKDKKKLLEKVRYYLKNEEERERITEKSYKLIIDKFSKDKELEKIFSILEKRKKPYYNASIFTSSPKVVCFSQKDINLDFCAVKQKLKNFDYVYFNTKDAQNLPYREQLQAYSIKVLKKPISCCDYYFHSSGIGNYLEYRVSRAFKVLNKKDFLTLLNINQIMVTKEYFLKNLSKFNKLFNKEKIDLINEKNTAFTSLPLVQVEKFNLIDYENMKQIWSEEFISELKSLIYEKRLCFSKYFYCFILTALFKNRYILRYIFEKLSEKGFYSFKK